MEANSDSIFKHLFGKRARETNADNILSSHCCFLFEKRAREAASLGAPRHVNWVVFSCLGGSFSLSYCFFSSCAQTPRNVLASPPLHSLASRRHHNCNNHHCASSSRSRIMLMPSRPVRRKVPAEHAPSPHQHRLPQCATRLAEGQLRRSLNSAEAILGLGCGAIADGGRGYVPWPILVATSQPAR